MMDATVAVSGIGAIVPSGTGVAALRQPLCANPQPARRVENVPAIQGIARNELRRMSRLTRYTLFAAHQAMTASGCDAGRTGLFVALTHGSTSLLAEFHDYLFDYGPDMASPNTFSNGVTNAPLSSVSAFLKLTEGGTTFLGFENAGCELMNFCAHSLVNGDYAACCAGASEEYSDIVHGAYDRCGWYGSRPPPHLPFPLQKGDSTHGFGVAEGSAFFVLEPLSSLTDKTPLCYYTPVDLEEYPGGADIVISNAGAGPQDNFELRLLARLAAKSAKKKQVLLFSKPIFGEMFGLGSMLSSLIAFDIVAGGAEYPLFPLHPALQDLFGTMTNGPAQSVLVIAAGRNGQVSAGLFHRKKQYDTL